MRLELAFLCSALALSPPLRAAMAPSIDPAPVRDVVNDVLRQQGFDQTRASDLANRIAERLSGETLGPVLTEREPSALGAGDWKDKIAADVKAHPAFDEHVSPGKEKAYPENVANFVVEETDDAARLVILKHLKEIEESGQMSELIATDGYWSHIFASQGYGDVYEVSRTMLKKALRAGLRPYKEGKGLNAKLFARLASEAIAPSTALEVPPAILVHP